MFIVLDIGGTKSRIGSTTDLESPVTIMDKIKTPSNPDQACERITELISSELNLNEISGVCVGVAGAVDKEADKLLSSPNLSRWVDFPLADTLSDSLQSEVKIANDTALGALGEAHHGAGNSEEVMGYITVGTGVGGSRVVNGNIDAGTYGFEPGHQIVDMGDFLDLGDELPSEGHIPGHLENFISGANLERRTGKKPPEVKDEKLWEEFQDQLVVALNNVAVMWSPDVIVVGGSMIVRNEFLSFAYLQKELEKKIKIFPEPPTIQRAVLQDKAGLVGARVYLKQNMNN